MYTLSYSFFPTKKKRAWQAFVTARAVEKKFNNSYRKLKKTYLQARPEAQWLNKQNINLNLVTHFIWATTKVCQRRLDT